MGKVKATRHQKFLKSEKAKVKLKAKKELPKGTNDTKTNFKVKKIIIREHAKPAVGEVVIKNQLGLKELLSRLRHFNTNSRIDALTGIKELVKVHSDQTIFLNVGELLHGVCPLVLDKERSVRKIVALMYVYLNDFYLIVTVFRSDERLIKLFIIFWNRKPVKRYYRSSIFFVHIFGVR